MTTEADDHKEALAKRREALIVSQAERLAESHTKLSIAYAFIKLLREGYDALLHHGVDYKSLPEYQASDPLDISKVTTEREKTQVFGWLAKVLSGLNAAVRRKGFTVH